jgi:hypothetical protein
MIKGEGMNPTASYPTFSIKKEHHQPCVLLLDLGPRSPYGGFPTSPRHGQLGSDGSKIPDQVGLHVGLG